MRPAARLLRGNLGELMSDLRRTALDWGHALIDLAERIYRLVRGLPHNRNTTIVVAVGCAILGSPLWEPYLRAWFEKRAGVRVDLPTEPIYGVILIALGLGYHVVMTWLAMRENATNTTRSMQTFERARTHDVPIFKKFLGEAPENQFTWALNCLRNDHAYSDDQRTMIINTYFFLSTVSNEFNDMEVQAKAGALKEALDTLTDFTALHFSALNQMVGGKLRYALEPDWNWDRGGCPTPEQDKKYHELGTELSRLVAAAVDAYINLIRAGQQRLL